MAHPYWPFFDLRITTPRLELRYPTDDDVVELAEVAAKGIHPPEFMPFSFPWTDQPSPILERKTMQHVWGLRAATEPDKWDLFFVVCEGGAIVGAQALHAEHFPILREFTTGSWLGQDFQGRGIGKEMRGAVLYLAFTGLNAKTALSAAFEDNPASLAVSRALGYEEDGVEMHVRRDAPGRIIRLRLERERWEEQRRDDIAVTGLEPCLELLGLAEDS